MGHASLLPPCWSMDQNGCPVLASLGPEMDERTGTHLYRRLGVGRSGLHERLMPRKGGEVGSTRPGIK